MAFYLEQPETEFRREVKQTLLEKVTHLEAQLQEELARQRGGVSKDEASRQDEMLSMASSVRTGKI